MPLDPGVDDESDAGEDAEEGGDDSEAIGPGEVVELWVWHPVVVVVRHDAEQQTHEDHPYSCTTKEDSTLEWAPGLGTER